MDWIQLVRWICLITGIVLLMVMAWLMIRGRKGSWWLALAGIFFMGGWFALKPGSGFLQGTGLGGWVESLVNTDSDA